MLKWFKAPASETQITHGQRIWLYFLCGLTMAFLMAPSLLVIPMSFSDSRFLTFPPESFSLRWYENYLFSVEWMDATRVSLIAACLTVCVATPVGTAAAYALHVSGVRYAQVLQMALTTPIMVPIILIGIGVFFLYARLGLNNTMPGLVLAHSMLALPFVLITVSAGLKTYDMNQELVARSLGASRLWAFLTVTLPQIRFSIISGALLAFITSLDEVVVALFISGGENATLTRRMFNALRDQIDPTIAAISTLLIAISVMLLVLAQIFGQEKQQKYRPQEEE
ncbi:MAG: ABC transporter permease [Pseudomonadota bacterium]